MKSSTFEEETAGDLFYLRNKKNHSDAFEQLCTVAAKCIVKM